MRDVMRRLRVLAVCGAAALAWTPLSANGQTTIPAVPATLGAITDSPGLCTPGPALDVKFNVAGLLGIGRVSKVSLTMSHSWVGDLRVVLIAPSGETHSIFGRTGSVNSGTGYSADLAGTYEFGDFASSNWWTTASFGPIIAPGSYRTSFPAGTILAGLDSDLGITFKAAAINGTWTLRITDECHGDSGSISAASLTFASSTTDAQIGDTNVVGSLAIPDGGASCGTPGTPLDVPLSFSNAFGEVDRVTVEIGLTHPAVGHLRTYVVAPDGTAHLVFGRTGATTSASPGYSSDLSGLYYFNDGGFNTWWSDAQAAGPNGTVSNFVVHRSTELGGPGATGAATAMNPVFAGMSANGTWLVRVIDDCAGAAGVVTRAGLGVFLRPYTPPTTMADTFATSMNTPLVVGGAGVLGNDVITRAGVPMKAVLVSSVSHGALSLQPSGAFTYTPAPGFVGADSFAYAAANDGGNGNVVTVSIAVTAVTTVQAPTALRVDDVAGHTVRLRWNPPAVGPVPTAYLLEGGVQPGQPIASLPTGLAAPVFTFDAPTGSFFVRVRALSGVDVSAPSNEVALHVEVPVPPSPPAGLVATVNGTGLALAWRNTFGGGAATNTVLDVTGTTTGSIPLGSGEHFLVPSAPPGTYTLSVRSLNAAGTSVSSPLVTVNLPSGCTGAPLTPVSVLAYRVGATLELLWEAAASGPAPAGYIVDVASAIYSGTLGVSTRRLSSPVPPGSYSLRVAATNACGTSAFSAVQTVVVP